MSNETWKPIEGTDGKYEVSNTGKVRSLNYLGHGSTRELSLAKDQKGYLRVRVFKNGHGTMCKVHREVAKAFIPNPGNKPEVNHRDGNKENNHVDNLEWAASGENAAHAYRTGLKEKTREWCRQMGSTIGRTNLEKSRENRKTPIVAIRESDGVVTEYPSQAEAAEKTGTPQPNINKVLNGTRKSANGFTFRYKGGDANARSHKTTATTGAIPE